MAWAFASWWVKQWMEALNRRVKGVRVAEYWVPLDSRLEPGNYWVWGATETKQTFVTSVETKFLHTA